MRQEARAANDVRDGRAARPDPGRGGHRPLRARSSTASSRTARRRASPSVPSPSSRRSAARSSERRELYVRARALLEDVGGKLVAASTSLDSAVVEMLAGEPARRPRRNCGATTRRSTGLESDTSLPTIAAMLAHVVYAQGRYDEAFELSVTRRGARLRGRRRRPGPVAACPREGARAARRPRRGGGACAGRRSSSCSRPMRSSTLADAKRRPRRCARRSPARADEALCARREAHALYERKGNSRGRPCEGRPPEGDSAAPHTWRRSPRGSCTGCRRRRGASSSGCTDPATRRPASCTT